MAVAKVIEKGSQIYDAIKSSKTKPTPTKTEKEIADEAYELGKEFAERMSSRRPIAKMNEGGTITPFGDAFNNSTVSALNKDYLQNYHNSILKNNLEAIDKQGKTNTMLLSTVGEDNKHYILPSYDPSTKKGLKNAKDIINLNRKAIDTGLVIGYPSKDIAETELKKIRLDILQDRKNVSKLNEGGMISPFMDNTNLIKSINENLQKKGVPVVDLRVQEQSISNFLKDDGMASKMYAITSGELSIDELKPLQQNMLNNLIAVSQYESSLGNADKDDYGVIKHSGANTVGMFGLQEGTVETLHNNGTLDRSITWDKISTDPVLANSVGALNVLQIDARAFNRTGSYLTPAQSLTMNRSGIDGTLVDNKYDIDYAMKNWRPEEIQNYNDTITFLNEIGINK